MMQTEVLIAGAGLGGLSVAAALQKKGIDYLLTEARERVGGRILTADSGSRDNEPRFVDLGPSWIWPGQGHVAALLNELGIGVFEQYSEGRLVYEDELGQVQRDLDYSSMAGSLRIDGGIARVTDRLAGNLPDDRIKLGHRVIAIRAQESGYEVDIAHNGEIRRVSARRVVLAIPPRVICAQIEFEPALPEPVMQELNSIPTWMAAHAKLFAIYPAPLWRDQGLSGDAISRVGPLMEIHDASPANGNRGALFGFVGLAADSPGREPARLIDAAVLQLQKLFGDSAASPLDVILQDWSLEKFTATPADRMVSQHPRYGMPPGMAALSQQGLLFASSETAPQFGGFIEGALEAAQIALDQI